MKHDVRRSINHLDPCRALCMLVFGSLSSFFAASHEMYWYLKYKLSKGFSQI